jgi:CHAD domain-containing protein
MIPAATSMREYAVTKTSALLEDAVSAIQHAAKTPDETAVHKMRVSIRRLQQAIRLFRQYLAPAGVEDVKDRLRAVMEIAGELRNRDIAIGLVNDAGGDASHPSKQRQEYQLKLDHVLKRYAKRDMASDWRTKLGLDEP